MGHVDLRRRNPRRSAYSLTKGDIKSGDPVLVRMHALDPMLDILGVGPFGRAND